MTTDEERRERNRQRCREYYAANREKIAERQREYRAANREQIAEWNREYRAANREKIAEREREYQAANLEYINGLAADRYKSYQRTSASVAVRHGRAWTDAEDALVLDPGELTALDVAIELGRTHSAVQGRRHYLKARQA